MTHQKSSQSGALFGMDARMALMIFTVLSGIIGYFAYGRVSDVRSTTLIHELDAYSKALQEYQTDMGMFIPYTLEKEASNKGFKVLWDVDTVKQAMRHLWHGPYVTIDEDIHPFYGRIFLNYATDSLKPCTILETCFVYILVEDVPLDVWTRINHSIDESLAIYKEPMSETHKQGRVRANELRDPLTLIYQAYGYKGNNS